MHMRTAITLAGCYDAEEILALQKLAFMNEAILNNNYNIPPLLQTIEELVNDFQEYTFLKAVENGKIIGSVKASVKEKTCYIGRLIVHPDFQNRGLGTRLMNEIEILFATSLRFELFTGEKSTNNIRFYENLGYRTF
ncbi:MAG TPA: GNAT family N-acetyltransferase, partial [Bacillota bacterium]|nr:GNAT family N-acetyltransferase [Bacillota bacterium]